MHIIFDSRNVGTWLPLALIPLIPLAASIWAFRKWRTESTARVTTSVRFKINTIGFSALALASAGMLWAPAIRVESEYASAKTVEGRIENYRSSGEGKEVSFLLRGVHFDVLCCSPEPVYRGTPNSGLTAEMLGEGMYVSVTYLSTGEIVRIEAPG